MGKPGRPTKCTPALIKKARAWMDGGWKEQEVNTPDFPIIFPMRMMLARHLGINSETINEWEAKASEKQCFAAISGIVKELDAEKRRILSTGGVSGKFQPKITSLLLSQVGVIEKKQQQMTGDGGGPVKMDVSLTAALDKVEGSGLVGKK
jgi:hypothetical protein